VCAHTDDYFAFLSSERAPLALALGAYACYALLRVDAGTHARAARLLTATFSAVAAWLALLAWELWVVLRGAAESSWSPGFALLGAPLSIGAGLALALLADFALVFAPLTAASWRGAARALITFAYAALLAWAALRGAAAGALALVAGALLWLAQPVALAPLAILWLGGARPWFDFAPCVVAAVALGAAALVVAALALTPWAKRRRACAR
jgi:hypothetical protein